MTTKFASNPTTTLVIGLASCLVTIATSTVSPVWCAFVSSSVEIVVRKQYYCRTKYQNISALGISNSICNSLANLTIIYNVKLLT